MATNEQPEGILLTLIRYILNITAVAGGLLLLGVLLFILVTRAKPGTQAQASESEAVVAQVAPTATAASPVAEPPAQSADSPEAIALGEELFQSQGCTACHAIEGVSAGAVGPNLTNIGVTAEERATEAGVGSAAEYIRQSIANPNAYIAPECPTSACVAGMMPSTFGQTLSDEQIDALVQYLLVQKGG